MMTCGMRGWWIAAIAMGIGGVGLRAAEPRPNVVVILADDLGFSDIGCYGGEVATPNLDSLAAGGVRFTQAYNTARCWPSRAALLTGFYAQSVGRDALPATAEAPALKGGGRSGRPAWSPLLAEMLGDAGYRCYHSGKWHIDGDPRQQGFDRSFDALGRGQSNFFDHEGVREDGEPIGRRRLLHHRRNRGSCGSLSDGPCRHPCRCPVLPLHRLHLAPLPAARAAGGNRPLPRGLP